LELRTDEGDLVFTVRCLAKSDNMAALKAQNPSRDPLMKHGDTPTGEYVGRLAGCWGEGAALMRSYGENQVIRLEPISGDAVLARDRGRRGLAIHGGDLGSAMMLRPTLGCIRVDNDSQRRLVHALIEAGVASIPVWVMEV
jgi:hypothetical protein